MRLFIAIQLNEEIRSALTEVQEYLMRRGVRGNFTSAENLHLTRDEMEKYFGDAMAVYGLTYDDIKAA